jgi:glycerol-1-phosphate dehydrogenase [NAD(P)+]
MLPSRHTVIPSLVRVKPRALDRMGVYAKRHAFERVLLLVSKDLDEKIVGRVTQAFAADGIHLIERIDVTSASFEKAVELFERTTSKADAIVGLGGGKALDVAKYLSHLARLPYLAVPTSLSNDGICSPQSSLTIAGKRHSLPSAMPFGVIIDTAVCLGAPEVLWHSGIGDIVAKLTAVADWKLAFHARGTEVDDFSALLSDASVYQFLGRPIRDLDGTKLLGMALMLNGISMSICGSSRPASGSEHLISHALDQLSARPRLHGLQVGVASYLVSRLQGENTEAIAQALIATGFWQSIIRDPFLRVEWLEAIKVAPTIKHDFYTVLSSRDCLPEVEEMLKSDALLKACFV